jgi:hypothetical protein
MTGSGQTEALTNPDLVDESEAGIFAVHPLRATLPVLVAPTTADHAKSTNTIRAPLVTIGCANLPDTHFDFDSSVPASPSREGFRKFGALVRRHPGAPVALFGHADPDGDETYNKHLSERRARAIKAVLRRDVAEWESLYQHRGGATGDVWGLRSVQLMLTALGDYTGELDGLNGPVTRAAIEAFQAAHATEHPGTPAMNTPAMRKVLFKNYMDYLCQRPGPEGTPEPYQLSATDFLSRGEHHGKGDVQGCSFFNPQLLLSQTELDELDDDTDATREIRHGLHAPDRRVIIFLFRPGTRIDPAHWPCPTAAQGTGDCHKRFWSDGKDRMTTHFTDRRRRFGGHVPATHALDGQADAAVATRMAAPETTFACRFYHGLAVGSPCERDLKAWMIRLTTWQKPDDNVKRKKADAERLSRVPLANARFVVIAGETANAAVLRGTTSEHGTLMIPVLDEDVTLLLKVDAWEALYGPAVPADEPAPPAGGSTDPDAYPDEADFIQLRLLAGDLRRAVQGSPATNADFDPDDPPPSEDESDLGVRQRLFNLGFGPAILSDWGPDETRAAVRAFQLEQATTDEERNKVTGEADPATRQQLVRVYGS